MWSLRCEVQDVESGKGKGRKGGAVRTGRGNSGLKEAEKAPQKVVDGKFV